MSDAYLGEVRLFGACQIPTDWMMCDGALLSTRENAALFNIIGPRYGGDGVNTFALPDLQSRTPIHVGQVPGSAGPAWSVGQTGGAEAVTLTLDQIPRHMHSVRATTQTGTTGNATNALPSTVNRHATASANDALLYGPPATPAAFLPETLGQSGGGFAHPNTQPSLGLLFCMCVNGVVPNRA
jgi:microcystin-dependent protein